VPAGRRPRHRRVRGLVRRPGLRQRRRLDELRHVERRRRGRLVLGQPRCLGDAAARAARRWPAGRTGLHLHGSRR